MIYIHEVDANYHPLDGDSFIIFGLESIDFSLPSLGFLSPSNLYLPPHLSLGKASLSSLVSSMYDLGEDDHSYLSILKQLEEGSHMHVGYIVEVDINNNLEDPKIVYIDDVLIVSKCDIARSILVEYRNLFAFSYDYISILNPNLMLHNIVTYPNAKPIKQNLRKFNAT